MEKSTFDQQIQQACGLAANRTDTFPIPNTMGGGGGSVRMRGGMNVSAKSELRGLRVCNCWRIPPRLAPQRSSVRPAVEVDANVSVPRRIQTYYDEGKLYPHAQVPETIVHDAGHHHPYLATPGSGEDMPISRVGKQHDRKPRAAGPLDGAGGKGGWFAITHNCWANAHMVDCTKVGPNKGHDFVSLLDPRRWQ